jgi:hypothetical protein
MSRKSAIRTLHKIETQPLHIHVQEKDARLIDPLIQFDQISVFYEKASDSYVVNYMNHGHLVDVDMLEFDKAVIELSRWLSVIRRERV